MAFPLPDSTGFQVTPTLHAKPDGTPIDAANVSLPRKFTVCVIGASKGIGAAIGEAYAMAGASAILLTGRDIPALEVAATKVRSRAKLGPDCAVHTTKCEITSEEDVVQLKHTVIEKLGRLDVVVVNAGLWIPTSVAVTECSVKDFQDVLNVDFVGCYIAAHHLIPILLESEQGARAFVAISGGGAWMTDGPLAQPAHCISKLAQVRLIEHLANQYKDSKLLAAAVHPGHVWTDTSKLVPEFHEFLTDDALLCGCFLVWLTKKTHDRIWLSGRYLSATWDVEELLAMKEAIISKEMLKAKMVVS